MTGDSKIRSLLHAYSYPEPILDCLKGVATWLERHLPVSRLLLLGSTSRGELSWYERGGELDVFSDLEFYLLTKRPLHATEACALSAAKAHWHRRWSFPNPFFHIDISLNPETVFWRKIRFDRRIAIFESISNAKVLIGADFDREPWLFGIGELDLGNTNELVLVRLWMQLLFTPISVVEGTACDYEWLIFRFALCRNILEVLTIFLPNVGILLPSYRQREEYFRTHSELHSYFRHFPRDAAQVQADCLKAKLYLHMPEPWIFYYERFLRQYLCLLGFLTDTSTDEGPLSLGYLDGICELVLSSRGRFMNDHWLPKMRRLRREARLFRRYSQLEGPSVALKWLRLPRRSLIICFLLCMHYALYDLLQTGESEAIPRAVGILAEIHPSFSVEGLSGTPTEQWLCLRSVFMDFMSWWQYNDVNYLQRGGITEWRYESR